MRQSATLDQLTTNSREWIIYPTGTGAFACGNPDGHLLHDDQKLALRLGSRWIAGTIACHSHTAPIFVAQEDQTICGLHAGMRVLIHGAQKKEHMPCSKI